MSAIAPELLRDPEGVVAAATLVLGLRCKRCEAEGRSRSCPNCCGVSRDATSGGGFS